MLREGEASCARWGMKSSERVTGQGALMGTGGGCAEVICNISTRKVPQHYIRRSVTMSCHAPVLNNSTAAFSLSELMLSHMQSAGLDFQSMIYDL